MGYVSLFSPQALLIYDFSPFVSKGAQSNGLVLSPLE